MKKLSALFIFIGLFFSALFVPSSLASSPGTIYEGNASLTYRNVTVYAPAVAQTDSGYVGVISTITVTLQGNGSGRVFVDTLPLTDVDMQGSARLAVKVASALVSTDNRTHLNPENYDYFFVVRTTSPMIGGPSAGAIMTIAVVALLENWTLDNRTDMTGMINPDGSIGPIGGIPYKIDAAHSIGATRFLIPKGQMTYTETVTETSTNNGWTQITTHPVTRNVSDYAQTNYGMEVYEVEDINDALLYFTGWTFPVVESKNPITTQDYIDAMKPISTGLLDEARSSFQNASVSFNKSSIPNRYPNYYRNQITDYLNDAGDRLLESTHWYNETIYYTSMSKSFQSLIDSHFVVMACKYFNTTDQETYVQSQLTEAQQLFTIKSNLSKNAAINGMVSLQCVGAAQTRSIEAESYLTDAQTSYTNHDDLTALYKISYSMERSNSVEWWLNITSFFNDSGEVNTSTLQTLADEYIDDAQQAIVYSQLILDEMGQTSTFLTDANSLLDTATKDNEKGFSAAALFESYESLVRANLALETVDGVTNDKVERARERASISIENSRKRGIEPVLAVSYYEYAQSLVNESSLDTAIVYYKDSDLIAGALQFTSPYGVRSSRYVGIPESTSIPWTAGTSRYLWYFIFFAVIGGIGGIGLGLFIGAFFTRKRHEVTINETTTPQSINDYYIKKK